METRNASLPRKVSRGVLSLLLILVTMVVVPVTALGEEAEYSALEVGVIDVAYEDAPAAQQPAAKPTTPEPTVVESSAIVPMANEEPTPAGSVNYLTGEIAGLTAGAAYTIQQNNYQASATGTVAIDETWYGKTIAIIKVGVAGPPETSNSAPQNLLIAARAAAPTGITATNETKPGAADAKIDGVAYGMEYNKDGLANWTPITSVQLLNLSVGTYGIRFVATATAPASQTVFFTLEAPQVVIKVVAPTFSQVAAGYTRPAAKGIIIENLGESTALIKSVTVSNTSAFEISGGVSEVHAQSFVDGWKIQPKTGLAAGTYKGTITVFFNDGTTEQTATAEVEFVVTASSSGLPQTGDGQLQLLGIPALLGLAGLAFVVGSRKEARRRRA